MGVETIAILSYIIDTASKTTIGSPYHLDKQIATKTQVIGEFLQFKPRNHSNNSRLETIRGVKTIGILSYTFDKTFKAMIGSHYDLVKEIATKTLDMGE